MRFLLGVPRGKALISSLHSVGRWNGSSSLSCFQASNRRYFSGTPKPKTGTESDGIDIGSDERLTIDKLASSQERFENSRVNERNPRKLYLSLIAAALVCSYIWAPDVYKNILFKMLGRKEEEIPDMTDDEYSELLQESTSYVRSNVKNSLLSQLEEAVEHSMRSDSQQAQTEEDNIKSGQEHQDQQMEVSSKQVDDIVEEEVVQKKDSEADEESLSRLQDENDQADSESNQVEVEEELSNEPRIEKEQELLAKAIPPKEVIEEEAQPVMEEQEQQQKEAQPVMVEEEEEEEDELQQLQQLQKEAQLVGEEDEQLVVEEEQQQPKEAQLVMVEEEEEALTAITEEEKEKEMINKLLQHKQVQAHLQLIQQEMVRSLEEQFTYILEQRDAEYEKGMNMRLNELYEQQDIFNNALAENQSKRLQELNHIKTHLQAYQDVLRAHGKQLKKSLQHQDLFHLLIQLEAALSTKAPLLELVSNIQQSSLEDPIIKEAAEYLLSSLSSETLTDGVPSVYSLNRRFEKVSTVARKAAFIPESEGGLLWQGYASVMSKVLFPLKGIVEGDYEDAILARAEAYLEEGRVPEAVQEIESLKNGNARDICQDWLTSAKERIAVQDALLAMRSSCLLDARIAKSSLPKQL